MTTKVTIEANHGWPVDVSFIGQYSAQSSDRVPAGEKRDFYVHSGQDILVHEVQPGTDGLAKREGLDFGSALRMLRAGARVARAGWDGKGMWLVMVPGTAKAKLADGTPYKRALNADECEILPHIDMWTVNADGRRAMLPGWLASQTDMLSDDWRIVTD